MLCCNSTLPGKYKGIAMVKINVVGRFYIFMSDEPK